jgi:hypothetical protein
MLGVRFNLALTAVRQRARGGRGSFQGGGWRAILARAPYQGVLDEHRPAAGSQESAKRGLVLGQAWIGLFGAAYSS